MVQDRAAQAGLDSDRGDDLALAVDSALTSALGDGRPPATLRSWVYGRSLVYEVRSSKLFPDPFASRLAPPPAAGQGFSFWLVNQACDLVELRPYPGAPSSECTSITTRPASRRPHITTALARMGTHWAGALAHVRIGPHTAAPHKIVPVSCLCRSRGRLGCCGG